MFGPAEGTRTVDAATLTATTPEIWCRCGRHLVEPHKALCPICADKAEVYAEMRRQDRMQSDCRGQQ